jgi:hypothetical protein
MPVILSAYPELTNELRVKTGYNTNVFDFFYDSNGEIHQLDKADVMTVSNLSKVQTLKLSDPLGVWHPETYNLKIQCKCIINAPVFLFGPDGLAARKGGKIGIALIWTAKDASVRGTAPLGELDSETTGPVQIENTLVYKPHKLRGTLSLKTVLYLKERGRPSGEEFHLADDPGCILGVLDETKIIIDGKGSVFPVVETNAPARPLWWVSCNWQDALDDSFTEDNFALYLNTGHKDFPALNANAGLANSPLLAEIVASALQILIVKVLNDPSAAQDTINGTNITKGSIASVVHYLLQTLNCGTSTNNPDGMAVLIRESLSGRMRIGG